MFNKKTILSLIVFITSCTFLVASGAELSSQEKNWLSKAYRIDMNGWIFIHIEGEPFERGFQRGYLTANEIENFYNTLAYVEKFNTSRNIDYFVDKAWSLLKGKISKEYMEEMKGMVSGINKKGKKLNLKQMVFMNGFIDVLWYWWPKEKKKLYGPGCSAFIATGSATKDGKIVIAHNSWSSFVTLRFCNILIDIVPENGHRIFMQTWGPCIYSATDFFITGAGLIGTETTIGGFHGFNPKGKPVFERAREAMQYARSIDQWINIMIKENNGAYANSWLIGNIKTNEIARLELGLKNHNVEKEKNGFFTGSNVTSDINILRQETTASYDDIRSFSVARRVRWKQLMKKYYGKIDVEIAKRMLADHYDVYLQKEIPTSRTICGHWFLDDGSIPNSIGAYLPGGTIDGKVTTSDLASRFSMWARWGSSCGIEFDADEFLNKHPQYDWLKGYLKSLPSEPWTLFKCKAKHSGSR